jgi:hypothetical protein
VLLSSSYVMRTIQAFECKLTQAARQSVVRCKAETSQARTLFGWSRVS